MHGLTLAPLYTPLKKFGDACSLFSGPDYGYVF